MENDLLRLDSILSLTVEEGSGVVIPQSEWDKGSGGFRLTLVGRLLSHRSVHFDALKVSLTNILQPAKGVVVRKVSESHRRIGSGSVPARPTYIWRGSFSLGLSGSGLRGVHIFGDFRRGSKRREAVIEKFLVDGSPPQERLEEVKKRLAIQHGKEKLNLGRRLMDERSDSTGPTLLNQVHPGPVMHMGRQAHLRGAHSSSVDSVGSSLGLNEIIPDPVVSPRPNSISAAVEKSTDPHLESLGLFTVELGLGILGHRGCSPVRPLSLPVNEAYVPRDDAAASSLPLVESGLLPLD
ncbi:hypothetical protein Salat_1745100 [Sesamum alatum]|uniref:Uncharacterized protein n=1 Tax=Sesamum alatum TaxID=300844 RepID=A0AAE2CKH7_9LAMI|nr:hypothetical protein Salat_1745100 [Sesamum alatum]